jgi:hypothetical protein
VTTPTTVESLDTASPAAGLLTVSQVCRRIPGARGNTTVSPSTVTRWILAGCPSRGGERVRLAAVRAGSRWLVAPRALDDFFGALGSTVAPPPTPTGRRTEAQRRAASARAARELERRGA